MASPEELQRQLELERAQHAGSAIADNWRWKHRHDFESSDRNMNALATYLRTRRLPVSEANLDAAFEYNKAQGFDFENPLEEGELPPTPQGCPEVDTIADIKRLPSDVYSRAHRGPNGAAFQARVNAILKAGI